MKEKTADFPSYSTKYLDDEIRGDDPDLVPLIYDISVQKTSYSESEPEVQNRFPTWAWKTLSPPQEITLEIWMIQGEPGLISKEKVLHSLALKILYPKISI